MAWNWTHSDWPLFTYDAHAIAPLEQRFMLASGELLGALRHFSAEDQTMLRIELLSEESIKTSQIEGEILDRASVQSSIRRQLGLVAETPDARPQERGIAEMMLDLYHSYAEPLEHQTLFRWHSMLMAGNRQLGTIGAYRTHEDAMQIVSGRFDRPRVYFEAPPSARIEAEMMAFSEWFNDTAPTGRTPLQALTRAAIGHLYFESIHPFEDGNGRLGRALAEKSLAQNIGQPTLILLAHMIERNRKAYYDHLQADQSTLEITDWLVYFANTILQAQQATLQRIAFQIDKTRFYDRFRGRFNHRQSKVLERLFRAGPEGFQGRLSAENYLSICKTSRATVTRDLQELVQMGALVRSGTLRHTRYALNIGKNETNGSAP